MNFRNLTANEIDCRIATCGEKGITLLLYKDARCDMNILDETVGAENWQRHHYECKGNLFCTVSINVNYDDSNVPEKWVNKSDCGTESYTEKEKGEASDSFKRACFNWGIGRELYTAPFIFIPWGKATKKEKNGKPTCYDKFIVSDIEIKDGKIKSLQIYNATTKEIVFNWGLTKTDTFMEPSHIKTITSYCSEFNTNTKKICEKYGLEDISDMTYEQFTDCCNSFEKAREKCKQ